ncbi:hypothetical protein HK100_005199 [Physocladia obscura]|uniref:Uncharacterized protein n=1 Tax=Physocladia obscura TaxID=109957 RepID=A0AAD5STF6_9FUNG|nr:hypothetical protein HK100_005199 [Physocladia obscura]
MFCSNNDNGKSKSRGLQLVESADFNGLFEQGADVGAKLLVEGVRDVRGETGLLFVALDDGEVLLVGGVLHDEPRQGAGVPRVDGAGLEQLGVQLGDGVGVGLGAQVDDERVDH